MATSTDTLIFEFKVKDEASKVFDSWEKKLKDLKKIAKDIDIGGALSDAFKKMDIDTGPLEKSLAKIGEVKAPFQKLVGNAKDVLVTGLTGVFTGLVSLATSAFTKIVDVGIASFKKIGQTAFDFVKDSTKTFISFEDQLAQTGKTMGIAGQELKDFGKEIIELAKPIGSLTAENLLQVAEVAGQLGIAKEDVGEFAVEIGKGAIALTKFGGDTEKLATSVAKQQNIFGLAADSAGNLLSVMDAMSKNTAANELQIANFNLGMAKVASTMNITAAESSALGAVLISGGLDASKASRLLSSSLVDLSTKSKSLGAAVQIMQQDMATGGEGIAKLEEITGRSRESFGSLSEMIKTAFGVDTVQSMLAVSGAFDTIPASAQKTELAYDAVGKTGLAVLSLLGAAVNKQADDTKSMAFAMETASAAFQSGQSHLDSYAIATEKTSEKIKEFFSVLDAIKLVVGEEVAMALGRVVEKGTELLNEISNWITESEAFKIVWGDIVHGFENLAKVGISFLTEQFREFVGYVEGDGLSVWDRFVDKVLDLWDTFKEWLTDTRQRIQDLDPGDLAAKFDSVVTAITAIGGAAESLVSIFASVKDAVGGLNIGEHFENLKTMLSGVADILSGDVLGGITKIGKALASEVALNVKTLANVFKNVLVGAIKAAVTMMEKLASVVLGKVVGAFEKAVGLWDKVKGMMKGSDEAVKKTTEATKDLEKATEAAREKQAQYGEEGYENSVWPDTTEWVKKASAAVTGLKNTTDTAKASMTGIEDKAKAAAKAIETSYNAVGGFRMTDSEFAKMAAQRPEIQGALQPGESTTNRIGTSTKSRQNDDGSTTTTTTNTRSSVVNVTFQGENILDESSKERFIRQITAAQGGLAGQLVTA